MSTTKEVVDFINDGKFAEAKSALRDIVKEKIIDKVANKSEELGFVSETKDYKSSNSKKKALKEEDDDMDDKDSNDKDDKKDKNSDDGKDEE